MQEFLLSADNLYSIEPLLNSFGNAQSIDNSPPPQSNPKLVSSSSQRLADSIEQQKSLDDVSKVIMSALTIASLPRMSRKELRNTSCERIVDPTKKPDISNIETTALASGMKHSQEQLIKIHSVTTLPDVVNGFLEGDLKTSTLKLTNHQAKPLKAHVEAKSIVTHKKPGSSSYAYLSSPNSEHELTNIVEQKSLTSQLIGFPLTPVTTDMVAILPTTVCKKRESHSCTSLAEPVKEHNQPKTASDISMLVSIDSKTNTENTQTVLTLQTTACEGVKSTVCLMKQNLPPAKFTSALVDSSTQPLVCHFATTMANNESCMCSSDLAAKENIPETKSEILASQTVDVPPEQSKESMEVSTQSQLTTNASVQVQICKVSKEVQHVILHDSCQTYKHEVTESTQVGKSVLKGEEYGRGHSSCNVGRPCIEYGGQDFGNHLKNAASSFVSATPSCGGWYSVY